MSIYRVQIVPEVNPVQEAIRIMNEVRTKQQADEVKLQEAEALAIKKFEEKAMSKMPYYMKHVMKKISKAANKGKGMLDYSGSW